MMQVNFLPRPLLVLLVLILGCSTGFAQTESKQFWAQASRYYAEEQYDSAQQVYLKLLEQYGGQADLYYNLGNTAYRLQQTDSAILFYEKSLLLDPHNAATKQNLALAQSRIINPLPNAPVFFFTKWWHALLTAFNPNTWAWLSLAVFLLLLALIYFNKNSKQAVSYMGRWLSLSIVCLLLLLCLAYFSFDYTRNSGKAVVMGEYKTLFDVPSGKTVMEVPEGTVVLIIGADKGYYRLRLPNGNEGWMKTEALAKI